jgi:hypothetical protein
VIRTWRVSEGRSRDIPITLPTGLCAKEVESRASRFCLGHPNRQHDFQPLEENEMNMNGKPKFSLGQLVATPGALEALQESGQFPMDFILRHVQGDWGLVDDEDKMANDQALLDGSRLLSAYKTSKGVKIWIITEACDDEGRRAATTVLLPDEY